MVDLPKDYKGLTVADWMTFRTIIDAKPPEGMPQHMVLFGHLRDLVNKSLKGTQFVSTTSDVSRCIFASKNWVELRDYDRTPAPVEVIAMQLADRVHRKIASGFHEVGKAAYHAANGLHQQGIRAGNDNVGSDIDGLLQKAAFNSQCGIDFLNVLETTFENGFSQCEWGRGGETRQTSYYELNGLIRDAQAGRFPQKPKVKKPLSFTPLRNLARKVGLGFLVPSRPAAAAPPSYSPPAPAND